MAQRIYFDESGFTGNNLLNPNQRFFAYASVSTSDAEASEFVARLVKKHSIQGGELKGSRLVKFNRGRKAVDEILDHFDGRMKISISNKKYALACKIHEYVFEPCYSAINSLFYRAGFHKFIANILYVEFVARGAGAEEIFSEFEQTMRTGSITELEKLFSSSVHPENSLIITQIREFAQSRADDVRRELASLSSSGAGKWTLDLTNSALFTLLSNWGEEHDVVTAVCDISKPLQHDQALFNVMIGREERIFSDAFGERFPITFNLSGPIEFADSSLSHGIQIADVIAAAAVYVMSNPADDHAKKWRSSIVRHGHYGSVLPDSDHVDLGHPKTQLNAMLLLELHSRAKKGLCLIEGMPEHMQLISHLLATNSIRTSRS